MAGQNNETLIDFWWDIDNKKHAKRFVQMSIYQTTIEQKGKWRWKIIKPVVETRPIVETFWQNVSFYFSDL